MRRASAQVLVIANGKSNPAFVAADLLSQVRPTVPCQPLGMRHSTRCQTTQHCQRDVGAAFIAAALVARHSALIGNAACFDSGHRPCSRAVVVHLAWCARGGVLPQWSGLAFRTVSSVGWGHAMPCHAVLCRMAGGARPRLASRACHVRHSARRSRCERRPPPPTEYAAEPTRLRHERLWPRHVPNTFGLACQDFPRCHVPLPLTSLRCGTVCAPVHTAARSA